MKKQYNQKMVKGGVGCMKQINAKDELRQLSCQLLANPLEISSPKVLCDVVETINNLFFHSQTSLYLYDEWNKVYKSQTECLLSSHSCINSNKELKEYIKSALHQSIVSEVTYKEFMEQGCLLIPLRPTSKPDGLIIIVTENEKIIMDRELSYFIKKEVEQLLNVLNHHRSLKENNDKKEFLFKLSTMFFSIENKKDILKQIMTSIRNFYPDFTYHLLLSHDYELEDTLPIRTLEYNQDITKKKSYLAFINGKLQIENIDNQTYVYAPLVGKQGIYGVLKIITEHELTFPKEDTEFITQFTSIAGKAIENATLYQNSKQHVADLQMINETSHQLNANLHQDDILLLGKEKIISTCQATEVGLILTKEFSVDDMEILTGSTTYFRTQDGLTFCTHLLRELARKKEPLITGELEEYGVPNSNFQSAMAIPMKDGRDVLGMVVMLHNEKNYFTFDRFKLLQSLIQHMTLALINSFLKNRLEEAVRTDYLTGLSTRNYLDEKINHQMKTTNFGVLILFDIDDFKQVNDTYGHYVGDEVIVQVADIIKRNINFNDIGARWGGEELAIYIPSTSIDQGFILAERIGRQVEEETQPSVTLSAGVSAWTGTEQDTVKSLFIRADRALYEAKNVGKNRVIKSEN